MNTHTLGTELGSAVWAEERELSLWVLVAEDATSQLVSSQVTGSTGDTRKACYKLSYISTKVSFCFFLKIFITVIFYCYIVHLQGCVSFRCTAKWFSFTYVCCIFFFRFFPYRLLQNIEYSSQHQGSLNIKMSSTTWSTHSFLQKQHHFIKSPLNDPPGRKGSARKLRHIPAQITFTTETCETLMSQWMRANDFCSGHSQALPPIPSAPSLLCVLCLFYGLWKASLSPPCPQTTKPAFLLAHSACCSLEPWENVEQKNNNVLLLSAPIKRVMKQKPGAKAGLLSCVLTKKSFL